VKSQGAAPICSSPIDNAWEAGEFGHALPKLIQLAGPAAHKSAQPKEDHGRKDAALRPAGD